MMGNTVVVFRLFLQVGCWKITLFFRSYLQLYPCQKWTQRNLVLALLSLLDISKNKTILLRRKKKLNLSLTISNRLWLGFVDTEWTCQKRRDEANWLGD